MGNKLKVLELFAGVGTQAMALKRLAKDNDDFDFEVVGISEIDKFALKSYNAIHGDTTNFGDITLINPKDLPDVDLITYSFPCTDISTAGKQMGFAKNSNTRSSLLWECEKIIKSKKPKYLLMENVKNLISKKFKPDFENWIEVLNDLGYTSYYACLNSKNFGVPQNRERVFMVSILGEHDEFKFPKGIELNKQIKDILEPQVEDSYYLSKKLSDRFELTLSTTPKTSKDIVVLGNTSPSGYGEHSVISPQGISKTLLTGGSKIQIVDLPFTNKDDLYTLSEGFKLRRLTPLEYWRLMGISDEDYYKAKNSGVSNSQLYKQAGNAIVVDVLYYIFKELFKK